ncbi:MAG: serine/threonine-protein kinase [Patescibacteria group bacterium]
MIYGGRYESIGTSGSSGGTGTVVICEDPNLKRKVVIKFLQAVSQKRRIYDEIRALQRVRSKHVVQIYDIVVLQPGNQLGIVQEYLPGEDLLAVAASKPNLDKYLLLLYQVACGLADIHDLAIIHRDVKPNNIKLDEEGLARIFDFDLARTGGGDAKTVGFIGTPGFAAPELYPGYGGGGTVAFTEAVDVYAFGATALYCAENDLPAELARHPDPPDPDAWVARQGFSGVRVKLPAQVADVLNACIARDIRYRPKLAQVRTVLGAYLVRGKHRALLVHRGKTFVCDEKQAAVRLASTGVGEIHVGYDGLGFGVTFVRGDVWINNQVASTGATIPGSCVITIGAPRLGPARDFITLDTSHPEVVL